jgi:hypothetical protein
MRPVEANFPVVVPPPPPSVQRHRPQEGDNSSQKNSLNWRWKLVKEMTAGSLSCMLASVGTFLSSIPKSHGDLFSA